MKRSRTIIFWIHLACGVIAAIPILIMSVTGIAIAFESEILEFIDRDALRVKTAADAPKASIESLLEEAKERFPDKKIGSVVIPSDPNRVYEFRVPREQVYYVDPYARTFVEPPSDGAHDVLHEIEVWHRYLGLSGEQRELGKLLGGSFNLAFLGLALTGLYLWFPRRLARKAFEAVLFFQKRKSAKARNFNWHHVIGFWSLPILIALIVSGAVISFQWAHRLVFTLAGEEPPAARGANMLNVPEVALASIPEGAEALSFAQIEARLAEAFPERNSIVFEVGRSGGAAEGRPVYASVMEPAPYATRGRVMLQIDPYSGAILDETRFEDRSPGVRARIFLRFLHTGEAFGLVGKVLASIASLGVVVLIYTGLALAYHRFFRRRARVSTALETNPSETT